MVERTDDPNKYLYHYTSSDTARKILASASLRLGRYRDTNDPKERKDWHFSVGTNVVGRNLDHPTAQDMSDWLSASLKAATRLACFCMDSPPLTGDHLKEIFNRGYCKPRMWAQYGASHTGVCLIFRKDRLVEAARKRFDQSVPLLCGPVRYINRPIVPNLFSPDEQQYMINLDVFEEIGREQYLLRHIWTHHQRLFFEKMTDWENEREWRIVAIVNDDEDILVPFRDALAGVMFGESADVETMKELMDEAQAYSPWFMALKWKNCSPWYHYEHKLLMPQYHSNG